MTALIFASRYNKDLHNEINDYTNYKKIWSSDDLVPQIIANAIKINITIVSEIQNQGYTTHRVPCTQTVTENEVIIWKCDEHYNLNTRIAIAHITMLMNLYL